MVPFTQAEVEAFAAAPNGCRRILNPSGMVQGYALSAKKQLMLVLPATPSELMGCFSSTVRQLLTGGGGSTSAQRTLWAVELGETSIRSQLEPYFRSQNPRVSLQSQGAECEIHITAAGEDAQARCDQVAQEIGDRLGALLTSSQGEPLSQQVGRLLLKHGLTVATAESGTAGQLASLIKGGSDKVLLGGMTVPTDSQKVERLGVPEKLLKEAGGISRRHGRHGAQKGGGQPGPRHHLWGGTHRPQGGANLRRCHQRAAGLGQKAPPPSRLPGGGSPFRCLHPGAEHAAPLPPALSGGAAWRGTPQPRGSRRPKPGGPPAGRCFRHTAQGRRLQYAQREGRSKGHEPNSKNPL